MKIEYEKYKVTIFNSKNHSPSPEDFIALWQTNLPPAFILKILHSAHTLLREVLKCTAEIEHWLLIQFQYSILELWRICLNTHALLRTSRENIPYVFNMTRVFRAAYLV